MDGDKILHCVLSHNEMFLFSCDSAFEFEELTLEIKKILEIDNFNGMMMEMQLRWNEKNWGVDTLGNFLNKNTKIFK